MRKLIYKTDKGCRKGCHPVMLCYTYKGKPEQEHYFSVDEPGAWFDNEWNCHVDGCDYACESREAAIQKGADILYLPERHGDPSFEVIYEKEEGYKRQNVLRRLKELIPSFQRDFIDKQYYGEEGWLTLSSTLPPEIPPHFLEGIEVIRKDGLKGTLMRVDSIPEIVEDNAKEGIPNIRKVVFSYMNYPGNVHRYGKIEIQGVELVCKTEKGYLITGVNKDDIPENRPELKYAKPDWKTELGRIVTEKDLQDKSVDWTMYRPGNRTNRFLTVKELRQTAVYVALSQIQGAFYMIDDRKPGEYNKKVMLQVDENDEVTFFNETDVALGL